jgi:hypothetical protein
VVVDVAAAVVVVVDLGHVVEERVVSMAGSVDLVFVLEMTSRTVVGCCSALFDQAACSLGHTCSARERQMLKPLLAGWRGDVDFAERIGYGRTLETESRSNICDRVLL